jgi:hypothetical protein
MKNIEMGLTILKALLDSKELKLSRQDAEVIYPILFEVYDGHRKVASNQELIKWLEFDEIKENFHKELLNHIRETGLSFAERKLIETVIKRVP